MTRAKKKQTPTSPHDPVLAYANGAIVGKIVAGPHVRNACKRHLKDLTDGHERGLVWHLPSAMRAINFFPDVLTLHEGQFEGKPFILHESQKFIIGSIFGWKTVGGRRRFRRAYIEEGKGSGKSPAAAGIGLYGMMADGENGAEIYAAGATKQQAGVIFSDAVNMARASYPLMRRITLSGINPVWQMTDLSTGSFFKPISKETKRTGSGPRPHFALADEVHEHPDRGIVETLERGFKFRRNPLLLMITNAGTDRNSFCYEQHEHAIKVAAGVEILQPGEIPEFVGNPIDDTTFSFVCSLDKDDDPLTDPSCWPKANPLLGITIEHSYLEKAAHQAKMLPGMRNGILRLHFCIWTNSDVAWMSRESLEAVITDFNPLDHKGKPIVLSVDLSSTQDLTSLGCIVETGEVEVEREQPDGSKKKIKAPTFDMWVESWTPKDTLLARAQRDKQPYNVWVDQGHLNAPDGKMIPLDVVAARIAEINVDYQVLALVYDRYAFRSRLEPELVNLGLTLKTIEHPQGGKIRRRPPDDIIAAAKLVGEEPPDGLWFPGSVIEFELMILEKRVRIRRNPVTISALMSVVTASDPQNNRWFAKDKATNRIDPAVAACMVAGAVGTPWIMKPIDKTSVYEQPGFFM